MRPSQEQSQEGECIPQTEVLPTVRWGDTILPCVLWDLSLTAVQGKWQWSHLSLRNTKLPGLPKPGGKSKCSLFPTQTYCLIYFHSIYTNTPNPLKQKWLPTMCLQFIFIPIFLDFLGSFSSLLLHLLVKNWGSKAVNQSQKFKLKIPCWSSFKRACFIIQGMDDKVHSPVPLPTPWVIFSSLWVKSVTAAAPDIPRWAFSELWCAHVGCSTTLGQQFFMSGKESVKSEILLT